MSDKPEWGTMTHKQACRRIANWLRMSLDFKVVIAELNTANTETPDVIGFKRDNSMVIEVKVSRADFLADKAKAFRRQMDRGMGDTRYFAAPRGIILPADLPAGWGLLEIQDRCVRTVVDAMLQPANKSAEVLLLVSAIRRLEISTAVFVRQDEAPASEEVRA